MRKFELVRLSELNPGDRFYFPGNKSKVYTFESKNKTRFDWNFEYKDNGILTKTSINRRCVYLRSVSPNK